MRNRWWSVVFLAAVGCADEAPHLPAEETGAAPDTPAPEDPPDTGPDALVPHNVLVILMDDVGLEAVAAYGLHPDPPHTPNLDALAERGVRFDRAYAYPYCSPSRAALLTGRYGRRTGVGANVQLYTKAALPLDEVTIAEVARSSPLAPYETAAIGKWHLAGETTPDVLLQPNLQGFDWFQGTAANLQGAIEDDEARHDYYHWEQVTNGELAHVDVYNTTAVVDAALERIEAMQEPWLLYLAVHAAHGPMHVPPSHLQGVAVDEASANPELFGAVVEAADTELGRLLDTIDPDVLDRTTIIFAGDNGTKGINMRPPWVLEGYKGSVADGGVRVPLVVAGPLVDAPGVSDALVHLVDVLPTVAELVGAHVVGDDGEPVVLDGQSLVPYVRDPTTPGARRSVYTEFVGPPGSAGPHTVDRRVMADHRFKLVVDAVAGTETFHAIAASPDDESADLLAGGLDPDQQAAYDTLKAELDAMMTELVYEYGR